MKGINIVGSNRNEGEREENDFYPTPRYAVEKLLDNEVFSGNIWECACGEGDISEVLKKNKYVVRSSDLIDRGYGKVEDFFESTYFMADNIITNPPFKYGLEFVLESKKRSNKKIAMFLKTVFLESEKRKPMFEDKIFPLKTVYQFSKRVNLYKNGIKGKNGGVVSYAWFVWDKAHRGKPTIKWI